MHEYVQPHAHNSTCTRHIVTCVSLPYVSITYRSRDWYILIGNGKLVNPVIELLNGSIRTSNAEPQNLHEGCVAWDQLHQLSIFDGPSTTILPARIICRLLSALCAISHNLQDCFQPALTIHDHKLPP